MSIKNLGDALHKPNENKFFSCVGLFSFSCLALSLIQEFAYKIDPCYLCNLQRLVYIAIVVFCLFGYFISLKRIALTLISGAFLIGFLISTYHLFVQLGLITDICSVPKVESLEEFQQLILNPSATKPCSIISWKFIGLPISAINALISALGTFVFFRLSFSRFRGVL